ncbi:MAG: 2Fe-2S iron-sulfur cluster-binding protein [Flavobacteriaceae bacterium]
MPEFHSLTVERVERLTDAAVVVTFLVPDQLKEKYRSLPGQYITLKTTLNEVELRRSYSLCSAPASGVLSVGIKEVPGGKFSGFVNRSLREGDQIEVGTPEGRFVFTEKEMNEPLMAIAAGSGITPIMSILEAAFAQEKPAPFLLLYGNKTPEKTLFKSALEALEAAYAPLLKIQWFYSEVNESNFSNGRIDSEKIGVAMDSFGSKPKKIYLCGPESLLTSSQSFLLEKGFSKEAIAFELFTASTEINDVEPQAEGGEIILTCDEVQHTLEIQPGKTILDLALQAKIDVPYSCQGGVCSSCIAKITHGKATMLSNQILTDSEVNDGLVLTCQAIPESAHVEVDYDDV